MRLVLCCLCVYAISVILVVDAVDADEVAITILHTGGMQGRYEQMLKAGAVSKQIDQDTGGVILLDSGNTIGSSEDEFEHPEKSSLTVDLMNRAKYDAWTLGRNELELSPNRLTEILRGSNFTVVGANLHRPDTGRHVFQVQPYTVLRTQGIRIGVVGLTGGFGDRSAAGALEAARYYVPLAGKVADVVIVVTHQPFEADSILASSVEGIDLIIGGYPLHAPTVPHQIGPVFIRHGSLGGQAIGRIDLNLVDGKIVESIQSSIPLDMGTEGLDSLLKDWTANLAGEPASLMEMYWGLPREDLGLRPVLAQLWDI